MATTNGSDPTGTANGADLVDNASLLADGNGGDIPVSDGDGSPGNPRDPAATVKRGRGRPRKDGGNGPDTGTGSEKSSGGNQAKPKSNAKLDVDLFTSQLVGVHKMLAAVTKNPLWEISDKEARSLAESLKNIMQYHSISIDPAKLVWIQFLFICAGIYGPRVAIILAANKAERDANKNTFDAASGQPV